MFRRPTRFATLIALACAVATAPAIVRRHESTITDQMYRDRAALHPAVGMIGPYPEQRTATVVAPGWILTAAHCATTAPIQFTLPGQAPIPIIQWIRNPNYRSSDLSQGYDFALARLATPVTAVTPMGLYLGMDELGKVATVIGAGLSGTGLTGAQAGTGGILRGSDNAIDINSGQLAPTTPAWPNVLLSDFDNASGTGNYLSPFGSSSAVTPLEGCVAGGDSGGPLLLLQDGQWRIAGVISARGPGGTNSQYNTFSMYGRINCATNNPRDWILGILNTTGRVSMKFTMADMADYAWRSLCTVQIRTPGTLNVLQSINVREDGFGALSFTTAQRGTFDIAIKGQSHLRVVVPNVTITNDGAILPPVHLAYNGDCTNDNSIDLDDFLILAGAYESSPLSDARGDIDFSGACNLDDFLILAANYEMSGQP